MQIPGFAPCATVATCGGPEIDLGVLPVIDKITRFGDPAQFVMLSVALAVTWRSNAATLGGIPTLYSGASTQQCGEPVAEQPSAHGVLVAMPAASQTCKVSPMHRVVFGVQGGRMHPPVLASQPSGQSIGASSVPSWLQLIDESF